MFDLRALRYFVAAYEERSITGAAKRCFIAQPSITTAIQSLESSLDTQLFERTRQGLVPTAAAERLYPQARGLLGDSEAIVQAFRAAPQQALRLHLQDDLLVSLAGPLIQLIFLEIPQVRLTLTREGEPADLKLVAEHCRQDTDWFFPLWEEEYVVLIPSSHPLRFKPDFELGDLHQSPFIGRPYCVLGQLFSDMLAKDNIVPDLRASATREESLLKLVELGVGLAVVPASHTQGLDNAVVRRLRDEHRVERRMGLACAANDAGSVQLVRRLGAGLKTFENVSRWHDDGTGPPKPPPAVAAPRGEQIHPAAARRWT